MTPRSAPLPPATWSALRPTTMEKIMPRLLRSTVERTLFEAEAPARHAGAEVDIVMDGQIVFSHAMHLQRS